MRRGGTNKKGSEGRKPDQEHEDVNRGIGSTQRKDQVSFLTRRRELWVCKCISELQQVPSEDTIVARVNSLRRNHVGTGPWMKEVVGPFSCRILI